VAVEHNLQVAKTQLRTFVLVSPVRELLLGGIVYLGGNEAMKKLRVFFDLLATLKKRWEVGFVITAATSIRHEADSDFELVSILPSILLALEFCKFCIQRV
jgi:hypothetical protein